MKGVVFLGTFSFTEDQTPEASDEVMAIIVGPNHGSTMKFGEQHAVLNEKLKPLGFELQYVPGDGCRGGGFYQRVPIDPNDMSMVETGFRNTAQFIYDRTVGLKAASNP